MEIKFSPQFLKQLHRQTPKIQQKFYERLELWQHDPWHALLRVHTLHGRYHGFYSINITGDMRALYQIVEENLVLFDSIGTHSQLYG